MLHLKDTPFLVFSTILLIVAVFLHAVFTNSLPERQIAGQNQCSPFLSQFSLAPL